MIFLQHIQLKNQKKILNLEFFLNKTNQIFVFKNSSIKFIKFKKSSKSTSEPKKKLFL